MFLQKSFMVACLEKYFIKTIQVVAFAVYVLCKNDKNDVILV